MSRWRALVPRRLRRLLRLTVSAGPTEPAPSGGPRAPVPVEVQYDPSLHDGDADPGEIVWTWVPYEDDASQGKDRPVLVLAREDDRVLALMLTSKDHDRDRVHEAQRGRFWLDIGSGDWDDRRRPSEVRIDRLLRLDPRAIRREGAVLDRTTFDEVRQVRARYETTGAGPG